MESHTILIVEDERESREFLTEILEFEGFQVAAASNGAEAWQYLHGSRQPCMIVLDMMMPEKDGLQACREIREHRGIRRRRLELLADRSVRHRRRNQGSRIF